MPHVTIRIPFTESADFSLVRASTAATLGLAQANRLLAVAALSAPTSGYNKTEVVIADDTGWTYTARIDLTPQHAVEHDVIGNHLRDVVRWAEREMARLAEGGREMALSPFAPTMREKAIHALGLLAFNP